MANNKENEKNYNVAKKPNRPNRIQENIFNRLKRKENFIVLLTTGEEIVFKHIISSDNFTVVGVEEGSKEMTMIYKHSIARLKGIPMTDSEKDKYK